MRYADDQSGREVQDLRGFSKLDLSLRREVLVTEEHDTAGRNKRSQVLDLVISQIRKPDSPQFTTDSLMVVNALGCRRRKQALVIIVSVEAGDLDVKQFTVGHFRYFSMD